MTLCENMHSHSVNNSMVFLYGMILTTTAKVGTIQENDNVIGEVNLRIKAKRFTRKVMQKNNIISVLG